MTGEASDRALMEFDRVCYAAGGVRILTDVSLRLPPDGPLVVIGPNGSGKTTLLRLAMGLDTPTTGRIAWPGTPPKRAIVFQRPVMLRRTVEGNLRFALAAAGVPRDKRGARAEELLGQVRLTSLSDRPARRLSGGEQHRLAIARSLARDPGLLLLDEPTASLDPSATRTLEELVLSIAARHTAVVMATHDLAQARRIGGIIVFMNRGRVIETGPAAEFFASPRTEEGRHFIAGDLLA